MVTYLYWLLVGLVVIAALFGIGVKLGKWKPAIIISIVLLVFGNLLYFFWLEQILVKRYGGKMSVGVPEGQYHIAATWKGDNLWIENYNPEKNECIFSEFSRGNLLEGKVIIKNCNPLSIKNHQPVPSN